MGMIQGINISADSRFGVFFFDSVRKTALTSGPYCAESEHAGPYRNVNHQRLPLLRPLRDLGVAGIQWSPAPGTTSICCTWSGCWFSGSLTSLLSSISDSSSRSDSESAVLDSSSDSVCTATSLDSAGSLGKETDFFLRSFLFSCLFWYEGLLLLAFWASELFSLSSVKTKEFSIFTDMENCIPFSASIEQRFTHCFNGVSHPLSLMESMESSMLVGQLLFRPGACVSATVSQPDSFARSHVRTFARSHVRTFARSHVRTFALVWSGLVWSGSVL